MIYTDIYTRQFLFRITFKHNKHYTQQSIGLANHEIETTEF